MKLYSVTYRSSKTSGAAGYTVKEIREGARGKAVSYDYGTSMGEGRKKALLSTLNDATYSIQCVAEIGKTTWFVVS